MNEDRIKDTHKLVSETVAITIQGLMLSTEAEQTPEFTRQNLLKELQLNMSIIEEETLRDMAVVLVGEKVIEFMKQSEQFAVVRPEDVEGMRDMINKIKKEWQDPEAPTG